MLRQINLQRKTNGKQVKLRACVVPVTFLRMFGAPLLAAAFMLFALLAPTRLSRWLILGASAIEAFIGAYAFYHWLGLMVLL